MKAYAITTLAIQLLTIGFMISDIISNNSGNVTACFIIVAISGIIKMAMDASIKKSKPTPPAK